jgi:hypothetical protein
VGLRVRVLEKRLPTVRVCINLRIARWSPRVGCGYDADKECEERYLDGLRIVSDATGGTRNTQTGETHSVEETVSCCQIVAVKFTESWYSLLELTYALGRILGLSPHGI